MKLNRILIEFQTTYAWGSPDIISVFTKQSANNPIVANAYAPEIEDISGKSSTIQLDKWVFDKVTEFLHQDNQKIANKKHTVFFLHLLGLDTGLFDRFFHFKDFELSYVNVFCVYLDAIAQLDMFTNQIPSKSILNSICNIIHVQSC